MKTHLRRGIVYWCVMVLLGFIIESSYSIIGTGLQGLNTLVLIVVTTGYDRGLFYAIFLLIFLPIAIALSRRNLDRFLLLASVAIVIALLMVLVLYPKGIRDMLRIYEFDGYTNPLYFAVVCYKWEANIVAAPLLSLLVAALYANRKKNA